MEKKTSRSGLFWITSPIPRFFLQQQEKRLGSNKGYDYSWEICGKINLTEEYGYAWMKLPLIVLEYSVVS